MVFVPLGHKHKVFLSKFGQGEATSALGKTKKKDKSKNKCMNVTCYLPATCDP